MHSDKPRCELHNGHSVQIVWKQFLPPGKASSMSKVLTEPRTQGGNWAWLLADSLRAGSCTFANALLRAAACPVCVIRQKIRLWQDVKYPLQLINSMLAVQACSDVS